MNPEDEKKQEAKWINKLGGTRFVALLFGMIAMQWLVVLWTLIAWSFAGCKSDFNWGFAITIVSETLACIATYILGKTYQHKKEIEKQ